MGKLVCALLMVAFCGLAHMGKGIPHGNAREFGAARTRRRLKKNCRSRQELKALKAKRDAEIRDVFTGVSNKFLVIVGPCSADNEDAVCEYTSRLGELAREVSDKLLIIPRIYTNKPRTTGEGYKGMLHQPNPEAAPDLSAGIQAIRHMHIRAMAESGLTAADEMLYPENRSYLDDILSYEAVGRAFRLKTSSIVSPQAAWIFPSA